MKIKLHTIESENGPITIVQGGVRKVSDLLFEACIDNPLLTGIIIATYEKIVARKYK